MDYNKDSLSKDKAKIWKSFNKIIFYSLIPIILILIIIFILFN